MTANLGTLGELAARHGLIVRGGFAPGADDGLPGAPRALVLLGNAGPAMWEAFAVARDPNAGPDPLDAWTRDVVSGIAARVGAAGVLYPFGGPPYWPFQRWAMRAEGLRPSPIGPLAHPVYGLWHAYRAALLFAEPLDLPAPETGAHPCEACASKPCLSACPVDALAPGTYDVPACVAHLDSAAGEDCLGFGCAARRACPVGAEYAHDPAQARFHMAHFTRANRRPAASGRAGAPPETSGQRRPGRHINPAMSELPFIKMHGLGNDFVVLDARARAIPLGGDAIRAIADRHTGVGCDQLIVVGPADAGDADARMIIYNADGSEVGACGNATRCVAALLMEESGLARALIRTEAGLLDARAVGDGRISVDMGPAWLEWNEIPLSEEADTLRVAVNVGPLADATCVSVGNPHAVFFVDDAEAVELTTWGPVIEHHALFPERTNVEAAEVINRGRIRMRVWERGTGITRACGSGACATLVAAVRRGFTERAADIVLDGGILHVEWREDGHVILTGPVNLAFRGTLDESLWK